MNAISGFRSAVYLLTITHRVSDLLSGIFNNRPPQSKHIFIFYVNSVIDSNIVPISRMLILKPDKANSVTMWDNLPQLSNIFYFFRAFAKLDSTRHFQLKTERLTFMPFCPNKTWWIMQSWVFSVAQIIFCLSHWEKVISSPVADIRKIAAKRILSLQQALAVCNSHDYSSNNDYRYDYGRGNCPRVFVIKNT